MLSLTVLAHCAEFDQIFMKTADMLLQSEHVGRLFADKKVVFIGDGDAIGLCLVHLRKLGLLEQGPAKVHVLDFDERVVNSVQNFAQQFEIADQVSAELYNVADPLPAQYWQNFQCFYTNPPFGASNDGKSIEAFINRGIEAVGKSATGCLVMGDDPEFPWTREVMFTTRKFVVSKGFAVSELLPEFHEYHLEDAPKLTSCSMVIRRVEYSPQQYSSVPLPRSMRTNFYGRESPLCCEIRSRSHARRQIALKGPLDGGF